MNNRKLGNDFEEQFCQTLSDNGFWVHRLKQDQSGQPADVIAAKNGKAYLIDCKVCSTRGFALSRIEPNQDAAMRLWWHCGNGLGWFAIRIGGSVYMISREVIEEWSFLPRLSEIDIQKWGFVLERWIERQ